MKEKGFIGAFLLLLEIIDPLAVSAGAPVSNPPLSGARDYPFFLEVEANPSRGINNEMQLLNSGIASLQKRINLIRKAKKRISLEYFIWKKDTSGLIIFHELIKKAKEGVEVRVIIDKSIAFIEMDEFYSEALAKYGIKLHHYNRALDLVTAQFRDHRKILVIDGEEAITGGRNIGNEYFDLDPVYNFIDRDIYIKGPIAKAIQDSFDVYWNHPIIRKWRRLELNSHSNRLFRANRRGHRNYNKHKKKNFKRLRKEAFDWIENREGVEETIERIEKLAQPFLDREPIYSCSRATYVSDLPGARAEQIFNQDYRDSYRLHSRELKKRLFDPSLKELWLTSPYFMLNSFWEKALKFQIEERKIPVHFYTNSLGSTDQFHTSANFYRIVFDYQDKGFIPYIHDSRFFGDTGILEPEFAQARWGMHDKTHIYDEDSFYVGTYNIDNRSDYFNTEMGIFCDGSRELRDRLMDNIKFRLEGAYKIIGKGKAIDKDGQKADVLGNASQTYINLMKLIKWPSWLFEFLM